jgi:hypothetical protein
MSVDISTAWLEAEKTCYTQLVTRLNAKDGFNAFRGNMPVMRDAWFFTSGGIQTGPVDRFWGENGAWCAMSVRARVEGIYQVRDDCLRLAGMIYAKLKESNNLKAIGNVMWLRLTDFGGEPDETPLVNDKNEVVGMLWRITIPLEMVFATEAEY